MIPFKAVASDLLDAARSRDFPYLPTVVDPGGTADPGVVLTVLSTLLRLSGQHTGAVVDEFLYAEGIAQQGLSDNTLTPDEARVVAISDVLLLARTDVPMEQTHEMINGWINQYGFVDALAVVSIGVQLLQFLEGLYPGTLAKLADDIDKFKEEL